MLEGNTAVNFIKVDSFIDTIENEHFAEINYIPIIVLPLINKKLWYFITVLYNIFRETCPWWYNQKIITPNIFTLELVYLSYMFSDPEVTEK